MMIAGSSSEHATAVLIGPKAVLIRGASGSGKSRLAWQLLDAAQRGKLLFARLIADDRVALTAVHGRLIAAAPAQIAGKMEFRGAGIRNVPHEPFGIVGFILDLADKSAARLPDETARFTTILGVTLPRLGVAPDGAPLAALINELEHGLGRW